MAEFHLIAVGKLKNPHLEKLEEDYHKRLTYPALTIHEVKAQAEEPELEAANVVKKIQELNKQGSSILILLDEHGKELTTLGWQQWLESHWEQGANKLIFILGGATGHGQSVKQLPHQKLALSKMTFPHKLARILLVEQLYRAQTLKAGHPYHNE